MKKVSLLMGALVLAVALILPMAMPAMAHSQEHPQYQYLFAGQTLHVGWVMVWNDADNLYVRYYLYLDWELVKTDVHVATSLADIPQTKKGNPKVGHFDYSDSHAPPVPGNTHYTYTIDLDDWSVGTTLYIAAHADVVSGCSEETAWAGCGTFTFPGRNWATYFTYEVQQ